MPKEDAAFEKSITAWVKCDESAAHRPAMTRTGAWAAVKHQCRAIHLLDF